jgi:uncharacterized protein YabN with tetrapyrrole methylase and pyrophosphatase domain
MMTTGQSQRPGKPSLFLIGLGLKIPDHVTVEAQRALSACARIYSIVQEPPSMWLPDEALKRTPVVNLLEMYEENAVRRDNYQRAAEAIIGALRETQPIGYVTYGNPLVYDSVSQDLVRQARDLNIDIQVLAGISSIDMLLCDLQVDMAPGIQICEATWMVAGGIAPQTRLPLILLQLGTFGSLRTHYRSAPSPASLKGLADHLLRYYPSSHEVFLIRSSGQRASPSKVVGMRLGEIFKASSVEVLNGSMYIPALETTQMSEEVIVKLLQT